jgi:hypothetical protein
MHAARCGGTETVGCMRPEEVGGRKWEAVRVGDGGRAGGRGGGLCGLTWHGGGHRGVGDILVCTTILGRWP